MEYLKGAGVDTELQLNAEKRTEGKWPIQFIKEFKCCTL